MRVHIPGKPIPYPRSGGSGSRRYTPGPFRDWLELAAKAIAETEGIELGVDGPVVVAIAVKPRGYDVELNDVGEHELTVPAMFGIRLTSIPEGGTRPKGLPGDIDNYVKAVLDAMQHRGEHILAPPGWILNDRQVIGIVAWFSE